MDWRKYNKSIFPHLFFNTRIRPVFFFFFFFFLGGGGGGGGGEPDHDLYLGIVKVFSSSLHS